MERRSVVPTYEYQCQKCGHVFEEFQSIKAEPLQKCIRKGCRGKVRRLIGGGAGLLFKGSGFYITDYRSEGYKKAAKAGESAGGSSGGESKGSSGGESKTSSTAPAAS
jgi:putative FmdB family regulatory protein